MPLIATDAVAHEKGWICFGGAGFVISTVQVSAWLLLLPQWATSLYFAAGLLGAAGWQSSAGRRIGLGVAGYTLAFAIVGQPFNQYWGALTAPLWALAVSAVSGGRQRPVPGRFWPRGGPTCDAGHSPRL